MKRNMEIYAQPGLAFAVNLIALAEKTKKKNQRIA